MELPPTLRVEDHGEVAVVRLARAAERNALDDALADLLALTEERGL